MNTFCDFFEAASPSVKNTIVKKLQSVVTSGPAKGMMGYYKPVFRVIRGTLSPKGSREEKLSALREGCVVATWTDKLNDARIEANVLVYRSFGSLFHNKKVEFLPNPRLKFQACKNLIVNLQPDLYVLVDGELELWKFGTCVKARKERTIQAILQMFATAAESKGLGLMSDQIRYFDARSGQVSVHGLLSPDLQKEIAQAAQELEEAALKPEPEEGDQQDQS